MEDFKKLWKEFVLGTQSLNYQLTKNGRTPFFVREETRFREKIVEPMDAAWSKLSKEERLTFDEKL